MNPFPAPPRPKVPVWKRNKVRLRQINAHWHEKRGTHQSHRETLLEILDADPNYVEGNYESRTAAIERAWRECIREQGEMVRRKS